jgi:hypothetical protein
MIPLISWLPDLETPQSEGPLSEVLKLTTILETT